MVAKCGAGMCVAECVEGCICIAHAKDPFNCRCECTHPHTKPAGKKTQYKNRIKTSPQTRYDICARDIEITRVAQFLDKLVPNKILVPASLLTKKVNLSLKKKQSDKLLVHQDCSSKVSSLSKWKNKHNITSPYRYYLLIFANILKE